MWASAAVRRSGYPLTQSSQHRWRAALLGVDTHELSRGFSSDEGRGGGGRGGGGRGGGRGSNRGRGGRGGRGRGGQQGGWKENSEGQDGRHGRRPQKPNFADQFLEPAAQGELKNHRSGIPKLAGRRPKSHGVRSADPLWAQEDMDDLEFGEDGTASVEITTQKKPQRNEKIGTIAENSPMDQLSPQEAAKVKSFLQQYKQIASGEDEELYYWNENQYDAGDDGKQGILEKLAAEATTDADGNLTVEVDDDTFAMFEGVKEDTDKQGEKPAPKEQEKRRSFNDDDDLFAMDAMGIKYDKAPHNPETYDKVEPLQLQGPEFSDFIMSMMHHPTKFAEFRLEAERPEKLREPIPVLPPGRKNPPSAFVEGHRRFIYVWGLPQLMLDGQVGDLKNPVHCLEMQKQISDLFDVEVDQVSIANLTSAFIGFNNRDDYRFAVVVGPMETSIQSPGTIEKYTPDDDFALAQDSPDSLVLIRNLPFGWNPALVAKDFFPEGTEVGDVYGKNLAATDVVMLSPIAAVLRLESSEMADSAIQSSMVQERLLEVGQHRIHYSKARRNLVFTGTHGGPDGRQRLRKLGPKLIVDGDMPTKKFFVSHAETLHLRNLDSSVTKQEIADFFQPFCAMPRDVEGSVEFVTTRDGFAAGAAYVGFDELGEGRNALEALAAAGKVEGLGHNQIYVHFVKDLTRISREKRQDRGEEELLHDLQSWEEYVDPADLELLYEHGISKESLDETFTAIRYQNPTFSTMDQAMRNETLNPEKEVGGMYRELVQMYVAELKDCLSTPENPGYIYESLFAPGEELDTEIFDNEPKRQEELKKKREVP
jgi:hypothetical protein